MWEHSALVKITKWELVFLFSSYSVSLNSEVQTISCMNMNYFFATICFFVFWKIFAIHSTSLLPNPPNCTGASKVLCNMIDLHYHACLWTIFVKNKSLYITAVCILQIHTHRTVRRQSSWGFSILSPTSTHKCWKDRSVIHLLNSVLHLKEGLSCVSIPRIEQNLNWSFQFTCL